MSRGQFNEVWDFAFNSTALTRRVGNLYTSLLNTTLTDVERGVLIGSIQEIRWLHEHLPDRLKLGSTDQPDGWDEIQPTRSRAWPNV